MPDFSITDAEFAEAVETLRQLIRIDTTNPPGNEKPAADLIARILRDEGLTPDLSGPDPDRPNLTVRLDADPANRRERPLVLSCHTDVVPADPSRWTHPPFEAAEADGCLWGRGAIDMKGFAVMALTVFRLMKQRGVRLDRDLIFAAVADEEAGTECGSKWLVDERPDLLGGDPEYVLNEVGGFTLHLNGKRFYPVQVAEKGLAWLRLTVRGKPGHSSLPARDGAPAVLGDAMAKIARAQLPWHIGPEARAFLGAIAAESGFISKTFSPLLLNPVTGPRVIPFAIPKDRRFQVESLLRNTVNPTRIHRGGSKINVLPGEVSVDLDGRLAPGQSADDLIAELRKVLRDPAGERFEIEVLQTSSSVSFSADTPLFEAIREVMAVRDPEGIVVPSLVQGFTDSCNYARLGATCYGFYPLKLPADLDFAGLFHGDDERIPLDGFRWGIETLGELIAGGKF